MYKTISFDHIQVNKTNIAVFRSTKFDITEDHLKDNLTDILYGLQEYDAKQSIAFCP